MNGEVFLTALVASGSSNPSSTMVSFLDLPAELRNKIYAEVAASVASDPIPIADRTAALEETPDPHEQRHFLEQKLKDLANTPKRPNIFALLGFNKQIRKEAQPMLEGAASLDLRLIMLPSSMRKMQLLRRTLKEGGLPYLRQAEIDLKTSMKFLFHHSDSEEGRGNIWGCKLVSAINFSDPACAAASVDEAVRLRFHLGQRIESLTITCRQDEENQNPGAILAWRLSNPVYRRILSKLFPKLKDIKCINNSGTERFALRNSGIWEMCYTHQALPARLWGVDGFAHFEAGVLSGLWTREGFLTAQALRRFGPAGDEDGQEGQEDEELYVGEDGRVGVSLMSPRGFGDPEYPAMRRRL